MAAAIPLALTAASGLMQYSSQKKAAANASAEGDYQGAALDQNATLADQQAQDAIARGAVTEHQQRTAVRSTIGSQRAALAAGGVDIGSGSAADVQANTAQLGEMDALTIRNNAARQAWGYSVEAAQDRSKAAYARQGGKTAAQGYNNAAVGSLLTTGASLYGQYKKG
jgi:hypothetical protein